MKEQIFLTSSPLSAPISLYKNIWNGESRVETISIVGGLHGNNLNGFYITARLSKFLQSIEEGILKNYRLCGKVKIFPIVNSQAAQTGKRNWPFDALDMDLVFPGNESGEIGERAGSIILEHTIDSTFGVILSTATNHYEDHPHIKLLEPSRGLKKKTRFLELDIVREISDLPKTHLLYYWNDHEIPSLIITGGKANSLDKNFCNKTIKGIISLMLAMGILIHSGKKIKQRKTEIFALTNETTLSASQAGLFIAEIRAGDLITPGKKIGNILDIYTGETVEEGLVLTLRDYSLVYEKEMIALILTKKNSNKLWPF